MKRQIVLLSALLLICGAAVGYWRHEKAKADEEAAAYQAANESATTVIENGKRLKTDIVKIRERQKLWEARVKAGLPTEPIEVRIVE